MSDRKLHHASKSALNSVTGGMTRRYSLALGLVALLSVASFVLLDRVVHTQDSYATTINVSGRQRMLLQRTALIAEQLMNTTDPKDRAAALRDLRRAKWLMRTSHLALLRGDARMNLSPSRSDAVRQLYFAPPVHLNRQLQAHLANLDYLVAMEVDAIEPDDPQLIAITQAASGRLANSLDAMVAQYEREAHAEVRHMQLLHAAVLGATLLLLVFEGLAIFRPMVRQVRRRTRDLLRAQADLYRMAFRDPLTELPNRRLFSHELTRSIEADELSPTPFALLQLDLDNFKHINDTLGHATGDFVLKETASRISGCVRSTDTVARLGGDEFAILLRGMQSGDLASLVADKIIQSLSRPFLHEDQTIHVGASIGITMCPADDRDPEQLWKNADIALHMSKVRGRGTHSLFDASMRNAAERRVGIESELRRAIAADQFVLFYQPMRSLSDDRVTGFEVLLRWAHPRRGLLSPDGFIDVAEDTGLIGPIGEIVLRQGIVQLADWLGAGLEVDRLAFNLAAAQLRSKNIIEMLTGLVVETGVPVSKLELEVTEGVFLGRGADSVIGTLRDLHDLGFRIALDDFGTGYGSLTHLRRFPIDRVKIDKSFVQDIGAGRDGMAIVESVIGLGHSLSMKVTAEDVEKQGQMDFLRRHNCDEAQGFMFGAPGPAEKATELLTTVRCRQAPGEDGRPLKASA